MPSQNDSATSERFFMGKLPLKFCLTGRRHRLGGRITNPEREFDWSPSVLPASYFRLYDGPHLVVPAGRITMATKM
jgi:hypothetical protein